MTHTLLHAVARKAEAQTPDADLLARFARDRDDASFEELVRRHGPLVWAVCRHLLPDHADAEDAFQAVFLALVRGASAIRDGRTLPAWLHGVAVRVATRAKRDCARRRRRESRAAQPEADRPVSDGAWEALLKAVHEEVQRLPDAERTAFVLCDLEGVSQPDAAARLGWPLGSLSGRLCKARQRLVDRLSARGVAPAAAVGIGLTAGVAGAVPANLFEVVKLFPASPATASAAAAALARGLTEGMAMKLKLMTAAVVVAAGFGLTGGAVWLSKADAQPPAPGTPPAPPPPGGVGGPVNPPDRRPGDPLPGMPGGVTGPRPNTGAGTPPPGASGTGVPSPSGWPAPGAPFAGPGMSLSPAKWEYKFVAGGFPAKEFVQLFTDMGNDGWEFCGYWEIAANQLAEAVKAHPDKIVVRPGSLTTLIFKRQKGGNFGGGMGGGGRTGGGYSSGGVSRAPEPDAAANAFRALDANGDGKLSTDEMPAALKQTFRLYTDGRQDAVTLAGFRKYYQATLGEPEERSKPLPPAGMPAAEVKKGSAYNVYNLEYAKAAEMLTVIQKLFPNADMTADPRTNTIIARGDEKTLEEVRLLLSRLDREVTKPK